MVGALVVEITDRALYWQVRALSFNHDSTLLAVASEDPFVDIVRLALDFAVLRLVPQVDVGAGEIVHRLETGYAMNTIGTRSHMLRMHKQWPSM